MSDHPNYRVPDYKVMLDGRDVIEGGATEDINLQSITVDLRRQAPASVELLFNDHDGRYSEGEASIVPGATVKVGLGYEGDGVPSTVFEGEVVATQLRVVEDGPKYFVVRAFDALHRMTRGRKTRTFLDMKFSDIISQISGDSGLSPSVEDTAFTREYVIQHNQTDLEFARGVAGWLDFDLRICHRENGRALSFCKPDVTASAVVTATYENPNTAQDEVFLRKFNGRQSLARVVTEVVVRGWSPKDKREIVGRASRVYGKMGGERTGSDEVMRAWGETDRQLVDYKVFTQEEADKIAETKLNEYARTFIRADVEIQGNPDVEPGTIIALKGIGELYSGDYFIEACTHCFTSKVGVGGGYTTKITAARCGW